MPDIRNDEPINSVVNDKFEFSFQASVIAKLVGGENSKNHLSVGVSGSWGSGKTSLLNMVRELLEYQKKYSEFLSLLKKLRHARHVKDKVKIYKQMVPYRRYIRKVTNSEHLKDIPTNINDVKVIWFDPWFFGSEETVIRAFFYRIAKELMDEDEELAKLFLKLAVVMSSSPDLPEGLPVVGDAFKIINFGRNLINRMSGDDGSIMDFTDIKRKICERLKTNQFTYVDDEDDTKKKTRKRIVVIIDDLDRLQVDEALTMLKVIRLVTEFGVNFVIGYDEETLSATIDKNCGGHGREYIRKMINVPMFITTTEKKKLENYIINNLWTSLDYEKMKDFPYEIEDNEIINVLKQLVQTLRQAINIVNLYSISYYAIKRYVDPLDYLGLCLIYLFYPQCFKSLCQMIDLNKFDIITKYFDNTENGNYDEFFCITSTGFENDNKEGNHVVVDMNNYLLRLLAEMLVPENELAPPLTGWTNKYKATYEQPEKRFAYLSNHRYYFGLFDVEEGNLPNMLP